MYGKTLSLPDSAMASWYELLLGEPLPGGASARDAKHALARRLVERFHSAEAATAAAAHFERVFVQGDLPAEIEEASFSAQDGAVHMPALIAASFGGSRSDARRKLAQGAVRLDGPRWAPGTSIWPPSGSTARCCRSASAASGACAGPPEQGFRGGSRPRPHRIRPPDLSILRAAPVPCAPTGALPWASRSAILASPVFESLATR